MFNTNTHYQLLLFIISMYTTLFNILGSVKLSNVFERHLLVYSRLHLFDKKISKNSNVVKYYYN